MLKTKKSNWIRTIRPHFCENISSIDSYGSDKLILVDSEQGLLLKTDINTDNVEVLNPYDYDSFYGVQTISIWKDQLYFIRKNGICRLNLGTDMANREILVESLADYNVKRGILTGLAISEDYFFAATDKKTILVIDKDTYDVKKTLCGIGAGNNDDLFFRDGHLFVIDNIEQSIFILNAQTGELKHRILTPFANPTSAAFVHNSASHCDVLYISYTNVGVKVTELTDDTGILCIESGNDHLPPHESKIKTDETQRSFIHPAPFARDEKKGFTSSGGYLIEMSFTEKVKAAWDVVDYIKSGKTRPFDWLISVPENNERQHLESIEIIGNIPYEMKMNHGKTEGVRFKFRDLDILLPEKRIIGWKALIKTTAITYDYSRIINDEPYDTLLFDKYLKKEKGLDSYSDIMIKGAQDAVAGLCDEDKKVSWKKAFAVRRFVMDNMRYKTGAYAPSALDAFTRGVGASAEFAAVILSFLRLNGVPCRYAGKYKYPVEKTEPEMMLVPVSPDYSHIWIEFYQPGIGWLPMESSGDSYDVYKDKIRYFGGLNWNYIQTTADGVMEKICTAETDKEYTDDLGGLVTPGDLGLHEIRFRLIKPLFY